MGKGMEEIPLLYVCKHGSWDENRTLSDETQPPDGKSNSNHVRGPTVGKGVQKRLMRKKGEKLHGVKSWKKIDQSIKDAVVQAVLDTFEIGEDFHTDQQAQEIIDTKAYLLYKDWRYTLNLLPYNHTSGSYSFPIAMSLMADENGELDFPEFYSKSHKSKKTNEWIDPKYGELHDAMVNLQVIATDAGIPLTHEELSRQVLGQRKNYLRGFGISPRPYSPSNSAARSRDKQMEAMRSEIDVLQENLMKEKEERQRDHEEMTREREELMKEVEEGKKAREAQQEQLNHLNSLVLRLSTLLEGSDGHRCIW
ncbi:hypothetical protein CsSME_00031807 [Camellia sinensis var. sinensis]